MNLRFSAIVASLVVSTFFNIHPVAAADPAPTPASSTAPNVVVYGGTPAGIAAALAAARGKLSVVLIEPTQHIGGLITSGLTHTDMRTFEGQTGEFLRFSQRVEAYYTTKYGAGSPQVKGCLRGIQSEPHVAELIFEQVLAELPSISIRRGLSITSAKTAASQDPALQHIQAITLKDAKGAAIELAGQIFIDASYEGDLMAAAGVKFRVGREGRDEYGEAAAPEKADGQLQAYNFRLSMTPRPDLRVPVPQPAGYDRNDYVGVLPLLHDGRIERVFGYPSKCIYKAQIPVLPNDKYDINDVSKNPVRLSMPGENLGWPTGDAAEREKIFAKHLTYNLGLLWFLQHDEEVPQKFREQANAWGLCKDEFTDNHYLPWQLYVREARRMVGQTIYTQRNVEGAPKDARSVFHADSIAMGDYGPNCHGTSHSGPKYGGQHEGELYVQCAPYQIPYGVIVPTSVDNLLVPVACSASHVGFCALRLEPIWTALGQAAGTAARMSLTNHVGVQKVNVKQLQRQLHVEACAGIYVSDVLPNSPLFEAVQWIGTCGGLHGLESTLPKGYGARGRNIAGQYFEAYPAHAFQPQILIDPALQARWLEFIPAANRAAAEQALVSPNPLSREDVALRLFKFAH